MAEPVKLKTRTIDGGRSGPHLVITGGVHGDEFAPMAAVRRLAREVDPGELRGRLTLVPVVNEPAFRRGARTAGDGLDLARVCPGRPDGSVTERIADALSRLIRGADLYVDLHSGGTAMAILPMVGYTLHPQAEVLERQRRMARVFGLPIVWGTTPTLEGRSLSVARDAEVPAIYAEYGGAASSDRNGVEAYVAGCLNVMAEFDLIDRDPTSASAEHVVEDDRPESGHLQLGHPSPMTGFFEPDVVLGERVEAGSRLGTVCDLLDERREAITAEQSGIVLTLRTFPRVREGDALAVILETERGGESTSNGELQR